MQQPALQWSDSWLLVALLRATEPGQFASLIEVIRAADAVNHSIITREELEAGFGRLVPLGLAHANPQGYAPAERIRDFWANSTRGWASMYESWHQLSEHIGALQPDSRTLAQVASEEYVSNESYKSAIARCAVNMPHPFLPRQ